MSKKNKKNAPVTPVVVDEVAQTPAAADVPTIDVQQSVPDAPAAENAHEIAPSSETIATNGHAFALPVTEIPLELTETPAATAAEPVKEKLFQLRLTADQLETVEHALITHSANLQAEIASMTTGGLPSQPEIAAAITEAVHINTAALEKLTPVLQMIERAKKAPVTGNGTGTGLKVFDKYSPIAILNWMGAHGFTQYDAKNALRHFGVDTDEIAKTTWSRALAKGKKPADNKVKIIGDLSPEQELELMNFYNLAAREAAKEAEQRIDATRARIKQLPAVQQ